MTDSPTKELSPAKPRSIRAVAAVIESIRRQSEARRRQAVNSGFASVRLSGFVVPEEYEIEAARFVAEEINMDELTRRTHEIAQRISSEEGNQRQKLEALYTCHRIIELRYIPI